jgi:hypothetical protein
VKTTKLYRVRRRIWRIRRSAPRAARPVSRLIPSSVPPVDPIFVIGCPRSGTTVLLQALLRSGELRSVQAEGHILWDEFHHPRTRGWDSDALGAADVTEREREYIYLSIRWYTRTHRFVDKTPENCLRIPYLEALFPQASFVFLRRRAADNVSSLMEGWRARPRFVKYRLPERLTGLGSSSGDLWSFTLIPEWRQLRHAPLEEICAQQYIASNSAVLEARESADASRWIDVRYEDLVAAPVEELGRIHRLLGLTFGAEASSYAASLADRLAPTTLSAPRPEKWREQNAAAIARVQPLFRAIEQRLGYEPEA